MFLNSLQSIVFYFFMGLLGIEGKHPSFNFLHAVGEARFGSVERYAEDVGYLLEAPVAVEPQSDDLCLHVWNFCKQVVDAVELLFEVIILGGDKKDTLFFLSA